MLQVFYLGVCVASWVHSRFWTLIDKARCRRSPIAVIFSTAAMIIAGAATAPCLPPIKNFVVPEVLNLVGADACELVRDIPILRRTASTSTSTSQRWLMQIRIGRALAVSMLIHNEGCICL